MLRTVDFERNIVEEGNTSYSLFWGGIYSQWASYPFLFNGIRFNCNEQMMMYGKAITFEDYENARRIMSISNPRDQKALGRKVRNFDFEKWNTICNQIVYTANFCKFTQNEECYTFLMDEPADLIVEASPYDQVWGIGLNEMDPRAAIRAEWRGENRLGQMITDVRDYLTDPATFCDEHNKRISDTCTLFKRQGLVF